MVVSKKHSTSVARKMPKIITKEMLFIQFDSLKVEPLPLRQSAKIENCKIMFKVSIPLKGIEKTDHSRLTKNLICFCMKLSGKKKLPIVGDSGMAVIFHWSSLNNKKLF